MKGVINKGIQELVEERFGVDTWDEIRSAAGCDEPSFSPSLDYPDQMTADLVMAAARYLFRSAALAILNGGRQPTTCRRGDAYSWTGDESWRLPR